MHTRQHRWNIDWIHAVPARFRTIFELHPSRVAIRDVPGVEADSALDLEACDISTFGDLMQHFEAYRDANKTVDRTCASMLSYIDGLGINKHVDKTNHEMVESALYRVCCVSDLL